MNRALLEEINALYLRLEAKQTQINQALSAQGLCPHCGWYNGHNHRDEAGKWIKEAYPIPVISLDGLRDIELEFDKISVSVKLTRDAALAFDFEELAECDFEAYGVEDYLADFYHRGSTIPAMKAQIRACPEAEIGFSFYFPFESEEVRLAEFVLQLRSKGFYY